jgi:hypothetical protein
MPSVASLEALERAVAQFEVTELELAIEPPALDAARRSLDESGLLLLGEVHGVRENPLLVRALMRAFGLNALALEGPDELAPVIDDFMLMLVVAGNAHTPTTPTHLGIPLGACPGTAIRTGQETGPATRPDQG